MNDEVTSTAARVRDVLRRSRIPLSSEAEAQQGVEAALSAAGIAHEAQKAISPRDRVDVVCGGLAIEIKVKGSRPAILRQLERYAAHPDVSGVMLVTGTAWPFLSGEVGGKPFWAVRLGEGWL